MAHARDQIKLAGGRITLYKRDDVKDGIWHCRIKMPSVKTYVRRSTGEIDFDKASEKSFEIFGELKERERNNLPLGKRLFNEISKSYFNGIEIDFKNKKISKTRYRFIESVIRLYFNQYFGMRDIGRIHQSDVTNYRRWRMNYWIDGPGAKKHIGQMETAPNMFFDKRKNSHFSFKSKSKPKIKNPPTSGTMALEWTILRAIMKHGIELGAVNENTLAILKHEKVEANRRPIFTSTDYRALYLYMRKWIKEKVSPRQKEIRHVLRDYILIMANSGLRNGEARTLKWSDIDIYRKDGLEWVTLNVQGKTGKRLVVCHPNTMRFINRLKNRNYHIADNDYIFCYSDGRPLEKPIGFESLLKKAGVLYDSFGKKRTIYSLRHSYATFRIQNGTNIYWLKKNMGTSIEMIEKHYGQTTVLQSIEFETGFRNKKKITRVDNAANLLDNIDYKNHSEYYVGENDLVPFNAVDHTLAIDDDEE